jgi:hypothetical protein
MSTEAINLIALEALLTREPEHSEEAEAGGMPTEHPLARELRSVLAQPDAHRVGDLARVVDQIMREMAMFKAGAGSALDTDR